MSEIPRSLITLSNVDKLAWFSDWWFSFDGTMWKFALVGAAVDVINWMKAHPVTESIDQYGEFNDSVCESILDAIPHRSMANHGHFNTMVLPKLSMLKEFTRLRKLEIRITFNDPEMDLINVALMMTQAFMWKRLEKQRVFNNNPNWGSANEPKWTEYL